MHKFLKLAMDHCLRTNYDEPLEYHLASVLVRGGNVIAFGTNSAKTNSFVEYFADVMRGKRHYCLSTHSEMSAILAARNKTDLRGCKMYTVRRSFLTSKGQYAMARSCSICTHIQARYGISRSIYSIDDRTYGIMTLHEDPDLVTDKIIHC